MKSKDLEMWRRVLDLPMMRWGKNEMAPLIDLLPEGAAVAEVGVFAGECSVQFLRSPRVRDLLCVDTWEGGYDLSGHDVASTADMEAVFFAFKQRMWASGQAKKCAVFTGTSLQAAAILKRKREIKPLVPPIDLVYLDADHSYEATVADIRAWKPLVKPGGILAGHDYSEHWPSVVEAVTDELGKPDYTFPDSSWAVRIK